MQYMNTNQVGLFLIKFPCIMYYFVFIFDMPFMFQLIYTCIIQVYINGLSIADKKLIVLNHK